MGAKWTNEQRVEIRSRLARGDKPVAIAASLGLRAQSIRNERARMLAGVSAPIAASAEPEASPVAKRKEIRDAAFWRGRATALERELGRAEHVALELGGVVGQAAQPVEWLLPEPGMLGKAVPCLLLTDLHAGEVIDPAEMLGLGAYNLEIARRRLRRYFAAAVEVASRWASDCEPVGCLLMLGGDLVSGDIHEELRQTNALTAGEQVLFVVEELAAGIAQLKRAFGLVHVASVPGNHGRTTPKPTAKLYARLSYDTLIARMLADRLAGDRAVTFQITPARDAHIPVLGRQVLLTHGDAMGTGGGQGFAGPVLPIVRGTKKVEAQQARANRRPDLICHGHFHTSANPGPVLANGSFPGYSEYGNAIRASIEPPQQWLFLMHAKWGLRERVEIQLEDPAPPELPRVRIPAVMRVA